MSFLTDVKVNKISFVRKAANKRTFLLLKSDDDDDKSADNNKNNKEIFKPMRKEVQDAILKAAKTETGFAIPENIVDILKADTTLNFTDAEVAEVQSYSEFTKAAFEKATPEKKAESGADDKDADDANNKKAEIKKEDSEKMDNAQLLKTVEELTARLDVINKSAQRRDLINWLEKECAFLPEDIQKTADIIMNLDSVNHDAAESFKTSLKKTSALVENSPVLREVGNSTESLLKSEGDGFELVRKFEAKITEIKKSADGGSKLSAETIVDVIKSFGDDYLTYRRGHILRAKRDAV